MPTYQISAPDGRKFEITAPEGATQEDALAYVQDHHANNPIKDFIDTPGQTVDAFGKLGRNLTTGIGSGIIGGAKSLYALANGQSGEDASKIMSDYQQQNTYQAPPGSVGAGAIDRFNSPFNPLNLPGMVVHGAADKLKSSGYPKTAAGVEGAFGISPLLGVAGGLLKKPSINAIPEPVQPTSIPIDRWTQLTQNNPTLRNGGAAATPFTEQARAMGVHPAIIDSIKQSEDAGVLNETAAQRHIDSASLPVPMQLSAGQATGDIGQLSHEQNRRGAESSYAKLFNDQNNHLISNIDAIHDNSAPDVYHLNHVDAGASLIDAYKAKDADIKHYISGLYGSLRDANGGQFPLDGAQFVGSADAALAREMKGRYIPPEIRADMEHIRGGGLMTFENFENMRTNLAADARKAERAGDGNAAHAISLVRNALESIPMTNETAAIKPLADAARAAARKRFDLIKNDPAYESAIHDKTAPDDFIKKFVINGKVDKVRTMRDNLADDGLAGQTIASGTVNFLKNQAGIRDGTGNFTQAGYNKALKTIEPKLHDLVDPSTASHLLTLGKVARYTQEQPRGSFVNNSNTLVGGLADKAGEAAWTAADAKTLGATKVYRDFVNNAKLKERANQSLAPGAGVNTLDFPKQ